MPPVVAAAATGRHGNWGERRRGQPRLIPASPDSYVLQTPDENVLKVTPRQNADLAAVGVEEVEAIAARATAGEKKAKLAIEFGVSRPPL